MRQYLQPMLAVKRSFAVSPSTACGGAARRNGRVARALQHDLQQGIHVQAVWIRVHEGGVRAWRPFVGPFHPSTAQLDRTPELAGLTLGLRSPMWRADSLWAWKNVEKLGKCFTASNIIQHDRFGSGSVVIWGIHILQSHRPPQAALALPGWHHQTDYAGQWLDCVGSSWMTK